LLFDNWTDHGVRAGRTGCWQQTVAEFESRALHWGTDGQGFWPV